MISSNIVLLMKDGMDSLLKGKKPKENTPCIIVFFNCPNSFYKKHCVRQINYKKIAGLNLITGFFSYDLKLDAKIEENFDLDNFDDTLKRGEIIQRNKVTQRVIEHVLNLFEKFQTTSEDFLDVFLTKCSEFKAKKLNEQNPQYYQKMNKIFQDIVKNKEVNYYYFDYEDLILIFSKVIQYFTQLNISIDFSYIPDSFILSIFGDEESLSKLAEKNEYELKMKPYGIKYQHFSNLLNKKSIDNYIFEAPASKDKLLKNKINNDRENREWYPIKYTELDINNVFLWPPYQEYTNDKEDKFQRYEKNDDYHECNINFEGDDNCELCSKFRNIDKLRIIYESFDQLIRKSYMIKKKLIKFILIKRNYIDYGNKLDIGYIVFNSWNIFNNSKTLDYIFTIRNFYGEMISYYFLWLTDFIKWLIFPSIMGIIVRLIGINLGEKKNANEILLIFFSAILLIWASIFSKQWKQKEEIFNYIWGTENYIRNEPDSENFIPDGNLKLIFYQDFPYVSQIKRILKIIVTYFILFGMLSISVIFVFLLFKWKSYLLKNNPNHGNLIGFLIGTICLFQVKLLYLSYWYVAKFLNNWQNNQKDYESLNTLAIKLMLFEIINFYSSIFYILFIKRSSIFNKEKEECYGYKGSTSCIEEMQIQLYTMLFWYFIFDIIETCFHIFSQNATLASFKKQIGKDNLNDLIPHSIEHQIMCNNYDDLIFEYSEMLILFGIVLLFGVGVPLAPLIIFILAYLEKFFDTYKIFFLVRVNILDKSLGIEIYNDIIQAFIYFGLVTNLAVIFFGDNNFFPDKDKEFKIIFYCVCILVIFIICWFVPWNNYPYWFTYVDDIKNLYDKKYFSRIERKLPHYQLIEKMNNREDKIKLL